MSAELQEQRDAADEVFGTAQELRELLEFTDGVARGSASSLDAWCGAPRTTRRPRR